MTARRVGVLPVRRRVDDRARELGGLRRLEDPAADEDPLGTQLHHERGVGRRRDAAGAEEHDGQLAELRDLAHELERRAEIARPRDELFAAR